MQSAPINQQLLLAISDPTLLPTKQYLRKLIKELKLQQDDHLPILKQTMESITNLLKDPNIHPKIKFQSHRIIMYLVLLADLDVYDEFINTVYGILKASCLYNKGVPLESRGDDYYKKYKNFNEASSMEKQQIRKIGSSYIIFCLETIYSLAKWLPYDLEDDTKPTKFSIAYESLRKQGVQFPKQENFQFYKPSHVDEAERTIRQIEKQFESYLGGSQIRTQSIGQLKIVSNEVPITSEMRKINRSSISKVHGLKTENDLHADMETKNHIFLLEDEKKKLQKQIEIQRNFFEGELDKQRKVHQDNIFKYQNKVTSLEEEMQKMKSKISSIMESRIPQKESKTNILAQNYSFVDHGKDKTIEELKVTNKMLNSKIKGLEEVIKSKENEKSLMKSRSQNGFNESNSASMSLQIQKLKKENMSLKAKLLTECSEASQFSTKRSSKTGNSQKNQEQINFLGPDDSRSCFEPFYSNSSSQIKIRLRKAILRQKQLLYRDKLIQIGCITKLQGTNLIRLVIVFTNTCEKPLFNFTVDFVSREDLQVKLIQNPKNYLEISGQMKIQILVTVHQIDFRCLLCSLKFNIQGQAEKAALILPISKLKLAQQMVYTPIKKEDKLKKIEKVFQYDRKMLPNIHKFKQYFDQSLLEIDRTKHEVYHLKMQFMGIKFYLECDEIEGELRIAVKFYHEDEYAKAEKLLQQFVFIFLKN